MKAILIISFMATMLVGQSHGNIIGTSICIGKCIINHDAFADIATCIKACVGKQPYTDEELRALHCHIGCAYTSCTHVNAKDDCLKNCSNICLVDKMMHKRA